MDSDRTSLRTFFSERFALPVLVSFLLAYVLIVVGLSFHVYSFMLGDFRLVFSFSEYVDALWSFTFFPYTELLLVFVAAICVFVKRTWLKLLLFLAAFVGVPVVFARVLPNAWGSLGIFMVYALNVLIIGLVTVGVLFAQRSGSRRVFWRFNLFLGALILLLVLLSAFAMFQHASQEANFERVFERVQAGEYAGVEEGLALCNTIRERSDRGQCMGLLGVRENDISLCYAWDGACVREVASTLRAPEVCATSPRIHPPNRHVDDFWSNKHNQIRSCITHSVADQTDVGVCEGLPASWMRGECVGVVARNQQSIDTCMLIEAYHLPFRDPLPHEEKQYYIRDSCLLDVIPEVGVLNDCDKIVSSRADRNNCKEQMSN